MYETHKTKDGETYLICQMDDSHLINTIRLHCNRLQQAQTVLSNATLGLDPVTQTLCKLNPEKIRRQAQQAMTAIHETLQPYVCEAALRGLPIAGTMQAAYGRSAAVPKFTQALPPGDDDYDRDYGLGDEEY